MKIIIWYWMLCYTLLWCEVKSNAVTSYNNRVSISCDENQVIAITGGSDSLVHYLLEQCNARRECDVHLSSGMTVRAQYWCHMSIPTLEIEKLSKTIMKMEKEQKMIGVMSEGYSEGLYQAAEIISCNITFDRDSHRIKKINFFLYDFASFANSTTFCLIVKDSEKPPFCSGSLKFHIKYGPFTVQSKRQFAIKLANTARKLIKAPLVRFWFNIQVPEASVGQMECQSKSVAESDSSVTRSSSSEEAKPSDKTNNIVIIVSSALGAVVLVTVVTLIIVAVCWCRRSKRNMVEDNGYSYIDSKSLTKSINSIWDREDDFVRSIPRSWKEVDSVNKVPIGMREDCAREHVLSMRLEMENDDLVCRGSTLECDAAEISTCQERKGTSDLTGDDEEPRNAEIQASTRGDNNANTDDECSSTDYMQALNDVATSDAACGLASSADAQRNISEAGEERDEESSSSQDDHNSAKMDEDLQDTKITDGKCQDSKEQDSIDEDEDEGEESIVNEYTSLNPAESSGDGQSNNAAENNYTTLGNVTCAYKIKGMVDQDSVDAKKTGAQGDVTDDSGEENDYLVLLPDDFESVQTVNPESLATGTEGGEAMTMPEEKIHEGDQMGEGRNRESMQNV